MKTLVNVTEKIEINLTAEMIETPKLIVDQLREQAAPLVGVIQLKTLIEGRCEEVGGYMIIESEEVAPAAEVVEEVAPAADMTSQLEALMDEVAEEVAPAAEEVAPAAEEVAPAAEVAEEVAPAAEESKKDSSLATQVVKDAKTTSLTPKSTTKGGTKVRADKEKLLAEVRANPELKDLVVALEADEVMLVDVDSKSRWFYVVPKQFGTSKVAVRFDITPRKNGDLAVSTYINGKASGEKTLFKKGEANKVQAVLEFVKNSQAAKTYTPA